MVRSFWEVGGGCGLEEEFIRHQLAAEPSQENIHAGGVGGGEVWRGEARSQRLVMKRQLQDLLLRCAVHLHKR